VSLGGDGWNNTDTIEVIVTLDSKMETATRSASTKYPFHVIDIHFETEIPLLGGIFGALSAAGAVGAAALTYVGNRKRKSFSGN